MSYDKPLKSVKLQESLAQGRLSRREVLAGLLGAAGALAFAPQVRAHNVPSIDPQLLKGLGIARANSANQATVFKPGTGLLASFGANNLLHVDLPTLTFELFSDGTRMFVGSAKEEVSGDLDRIALGNTFTHTENITAADGSAIRVVTTLRPVFDATPVAARKPSLFNPVSDDSGEDNSGEVNHRRFSGTSFRGIFEAGLPNQKPTSRFETIYNFNEDFFPLGFETSGSLPNFNYIPLIFASHAVNGVFHTRSFPNPESAAVTGRASWGCWAVCAAAALACAACAGNPAACGACFLLGAECLDCQRTGLFTSGIDGGIIF